MLSERWQCLLVPKSINTLGWTLKNHAWGGGELWGHNQVGKTPLLLLPLDVCSQVCL